MPVPNDYCDKVVCVLGLGFVGLPLAATMADVGFKVHGIEIRDDVRDLLRRGEPHLHEPGLKRMLRRALGSGRLSLAKHMTVEIASPVYIITVGTPLNSDGRSRMDMINTVSREISTVLKDGDLVIMRSTVKIGTTRDVVVPILAEAGVDYDLAFCPERTLEGKALEELRYLPQIVGGLEARAVERASELFRFVAPMVVPVETVETAEMIKLVDNAQRDVSFGFSNEVARMCDAIGISSRDVIESGKREYPRTNLPLPGPVGGPCLEKDPLILAESMEAHEIVPEITMAARRLNEGQPAEIVTWLKKLISGVDGFPAVPAVTLAGIAFKGVPETDDIRGTMARPILEELQRAFPTAEFSGFDEVVSAKSIEEFGLIPCATLEDAFEGANLVVIANNHPGFATVEIEPLAERMARPGIIYDFWNNFTASELNLPTGTGYIALGAHGECNLP